MQLNEVIQKVIDNPTEENKTLYLNYINNKEYSLLLEAKEKPFKSKEYFHKRTEAFAYRRESAMVMIREWVKKYNTSDGCPVTYADTLNIPFRDIKVPKGVDTEQDCF